MKEGKRCCACNKYKDLSHFHKNKSAKDGLSSYCRGCASIKSREGYKRRRDGIQRRISNKKAAELLRLGKKHCSLCYKIKDISCFIPNASRPGQYHGWCKGCKNKFYKSKRAKRALLGNTGGRISPIYKAKLISKGKSYCASCRTIKNTNEFHRQKSNKFGISDVCKECVNKKDRGRRVYNKERKWRSYGININYSEFLIKLSDQKGCCAICGRSRKSFKYDLNVDHNHISGQVRGLLCARCNYIIGIIEGEPGRLAKAYLYLKKWNKKAS